jgi:antitoxin (DNA-binding transcriptional repressor) of toxin-antitoxin stability system
MITLSPTKARANLTVWLKAAASGEDVGILYGDRVIALRPVTVESTDYALREYGAGVEEMDRFSKRAHEEIEKDRRSGNLRTFTGDIEDLLESPGH